MLLSSTPWNLQVVDTTGASRALLCPTLTILLASMWLSNQVSAFLYDRQVRALGIDPAVENRPQIRARQSEQLPLDFAPQGALFDDKNIPSEALLSDFDQSALTDGKNILLTFSLSSFG